MLKENWSRLHGARRDLADQVKRGIDQKVILTIRAFMIGLQMDVVANEFNGTAWRCSNKDNRSTIDEAFADCALPTPPGPTPLWNYQAEYRNEVNCMNASKDFQDAESVRSGNSHVTSRPMSFPTHPISEGLLRYSYVTPSRREGPPSSWDTHGKSGNVL